MTDHINVEYRLCIMPSASTPQHEQYVKVIHGLKTIDE